MRILKIVGTVIGFLVVIFLLIGIINPSFEYDNAVIINAPKAKVWSLYNDQKKDWIDGFKSQKLVAGMPLTKDAEYETTIVSGEEMVMHEKIVSISPGDSVVWSLKNDVLISNYSYQFKGDSLTTEVKTRYRVEGKNAFMRSILFLSQGYLKSSDAEMLQGLKRIAETEK